MNATILRRLLVVAAAVLAVIWANAASAQVVNINETEPHRLRGPSLARKTGRTNKTAGGARRQTIVVSVLESLRQHRSTYTLSSVIREVLAWSAAGQSCFARLLNQLRPAPLVPPLPAASRLDRLLPVPSG